MVRRAGKDTRTRSRRGPFERHEAGDVERGATRQGHKLARREKHSNRIPAVVRDPKDHYLIAHAVLAQADYIVTGAKDLLSLARLDTVRILGPRKFWKTLQGLEP